MLVRVATDEEDDQDDRVGDVGFADVGRTGEEVDGGEVTSSESLLVDNDGQVVAASSSAAAAVSVGVVDAEALVVVAFWQQPS